MVLCCYLVSGTNVLFTLTCRQKLLTNEEARNVSQEIMNDLRKYKSDMEKEASKQERALHNRLSELKKKQLDAKVSVTGWFGPVYMLVL